MHVPTLTVAGVRGITISVGILVPLAANFQSGQIGAEALVAEGTIATVFGGRTASIKYLWA